MNPSWGAVYSMHSIWVVPETRMGPQEASLAQGLFCSILRKGSPRRSKDRACLSLPWGRGAGKGNPRLSGCLCL